VTYYFNYYYYYYYLKSEIQNVLHCGQNSTEFCSIRCFISLNPPSVTDQNDEYRILEAMVTNFSELYFSSFEC
jgi:hypothetical protein